MANVTTKTVPLALVEWNDANTGPADEAITLEDVHQSHKPVLVTTLGWVLKQDEAGVTLANEFYEGCYRGRTFIPAPMIVKVQGFGLVKKREKKSDPSDPTHIPPN